jgi:hypothetical protein
MIPTEDKMWEQEVSSDLSEGLQQIRSETAPPESLERSLAAAEHISMTSAAWSRGIKNALIVSLVIFPLLGCVVYVISRLTQLGLTLSMMLAFGGFWMISFSVFLVSWLKGLIARGSENELLLDCGPHPTRKLFLFNGVLFLIGGIAAGFSSAEWTSLAGMLYCVSFAVFWFIVSRGRLLL